MEDTAMEARGYFLHGGKTLRFLSFSNYEQCHYGGEPREFLYRLPADDPRPLGFHYSGYDELPDYCEWFKSLPEKQWLELVYT